MKKIYYYFCLVFILFFNPLDGICDEAQFVISPPPITTASFEKGAVNKRFDFTAITIDSDYFSAAGLGFDLKARKAFTGMFALDVQGGVIGLAGEIDSDSKYFEDPTFSMVTFPASLNIEFQPINNDKFSTILFGGVLGSYSYQRFESGDNDFNTEQTMSGGQFGIQFGIHLERFTLSPFAMKSSQSGESTTDGNTTDIDEIDSTVYGFDILHKPSGITLSALADIASKVADESSSSDEDSDTEMYTLRLGFNF